MYALQISGVDRVYQTGDVTFQALKNINLEIKKGEFVAIVGPSGSGKSTLMHILGLLDTPTNGSYLLDGQDVARLHEEHRAEIRNKKIGFVFQSFNLLKRTRAVDNVALPLLYQGIEKKERIRRATEALNEVGLGEKLNSRPNELSGGQQQRVAIARAIVTNPEIILADEPTGNLDSKTGDTIIDLFKSLNKQGRTVVFITHSEEVARTANRIIKIKDGEVVDTRLRRGRQ